MKLNLNRKKKAWIIAGVSFAFVLGCAGLVWVDHGTITEEEGKIASLKSEIAKADATIAGIKKVEDRVLAERLRVKEYTQILPLDKDIHNFVDRITEFEAAANVEIETLDDKSARNRKKKKSKDAFIRINYKIALTATVSQLLDFMHLFESYDRFVTVKEFQVKGGDPVELDDGTVLAARHDVQILLETYVYMPKNAMQEPVKIPNAEDRIAAIAEEIGIGEGLELETYAYETSENRRDPLANPRIDLDDESGLGEGPALEEQNRVLAELETEFGEIEAQLELEARETDLVVKYELSRRLDSRLGQLRDRISELDVAKFFTSPETNQRFKRQVGDPLATLLKERLGSELQLMPMDELKAQYSLMEDYFEGRKFSDTVALGQTLLQSRGDKMPPAMVLLFREIEALVARSQLYLDFSQIEMTFNGVVVPKGNDSASIVIINGRAYSPGDELDEGLIVKEVRSTGVDFLFKGERITRVLE